MERLSPSSSPSSSNSPEPEPIEIEAPSSSHHSSSNKRPLGHQSGGGQSLKSRKRGDHDRHQRDQVRDDQYARGGSGPVGADKKKDELLDVEHVKFLRRIIGDPFDESPL